MEDRSVAAELSLFKKAGVGRAVIGQNSSLIVNCS